MDQRLRIAIVGSTGAVGQEFLGLLRDRADSIGELRLLASSRSAGSHVSWCGQDLTVAEVAPQSFEGIDVAFFSAGASRSREFAPHAMDAGAVVIDNSSAFRMKEGVPLVVPEINFDSIGPGDKLIANPNCSAIIMLMAVAPLRKLGKIKRIILSTYQSASGGGASVMHELESQTREVLAGKPAEPKVLDRPYAFNLFSHNTPIGENGYNEEENKVVEESRKILGEPELPINVTCVRVPVLRAHSQSITIEFEGAAPSEDQVRDTLAAFPGVKVVDDRAHNHFPTPLEASGQADVLVGRIRRDLSNPDAICLFVSGDQLLKGAALNAVQIGEKMFSGRLVGV